MSNFKLTFKLKQHTPLIHFQHDQHGATLRATELKPKLDRFLIEKAFGGILNFNTYKNFLIGDTKSIEEKLKKIDKENSDETVRNKKKEKYLKEQHLAFDYKVRIIGKAVEMNKISRVPNFFGNMGVYDDKEKKKFSNTNQILNVTITTFNESLKKKICEIFPIFLAKTNFGTRQNKGFGSFYLDNSSECYESINSILNGVPYIEIDNHSNEHIYSAINYYYSRLKSGINKNYDARCNSEYKKSFLFKYFNNKTKKGWEKRWIKENFFGLYNNNIDKYFIRILLGFSTSFKYKKTIEPCHKKNDKKIPKSYEILDEYEIEVTHPNIERYKSPITFKPIKIKENGKDITRIYIVTEQNLIQSISISQPFTFYKKFIVKKIYLNSRNEVKTKQIAFPKIKNENVREKDRLIQELSNQEKHNNIESIKNVIIKIKNDRKRKNLLKQINSFIIGQKARFENYLNECTENNGKIYPPSRTIEAPNTIIDLQDLIKEYHTTELNNSFSYELNSSNYNAKIKNNNQ